MDKSIFLLEEYLKQNISNKFQYINTPYLESDKNWNHDYSIEIRNRNQTKMKVNGSKGVIQGG